MIFENLEITGGYGQTIMTELENIKNQLRAEVYNRKTEALGWGDFLSTARWYLYHKPDSPGAGYVYNWNSTFRRNVSGTGSTAIVTSALVCTCVLSTISPAGPRSMTTRVPDGSSPARTILAITSSICF